MQSGQNLNNQVLPSYSPCISEPDCREFSLRHRQKKPRSDREVGKEIQASDSADGRDGRSATVGGKRGRRARKSNRVDMKTKLERSRQSARECRARKKLRYQYLEDLVNKRQRAVFSLREELNSYKNWCEAVDRGEDPKQALDSIIKENSNITDKI